MKGRKVCTDCGRRKGSGSFYRNPGARDGLAGICKKCHKARMRRHRQENLESVRSYDRARSRLPHRRDHLKRVSREWREKYPDRYRAHTAVNNAVRDGRIEKPDHCEQCGRKCRLHGHHRDYARPLDVKWLCAACHAAEHHD